MEKINVHNYITILYHIAIQVDLECGEESIRKKRIQQIYVDRVINDHYNDDKMRKKMLSLVDTSVTDFIKIFYRHVPIEKSRCCC